MALIEPGDTILGLALDHGGHLSHGMKLNVSGKLYNPVAYHVRREDHRVDMDEVARLAAEHKPALIVAGWSAYPRQLDFAAFREIADSVGAMLMVDMAHFAGLVAAGEHPNPVPHADVVTTTIHKTLCGPRSGMILCRDEHAKAIDKAIFPGQQGGPLMHTIAAKAVALAIAASEPFRARQRQTIANARALGAGAAKPDGVPVLTGGTDVHLVLVDLTPTGLDGQTAEDRLEAIGITVNRNAIPFDARPPMNPSGLRIGTPALTTRGLDEDDMTEIAAVIAAALGPDFEAEKAALAERTGALMDRYPLYPQLDAERRLRRRRATPPVRVGGRCRGSGSTAPPPRTRWCCGRSIERLRGAGPRGLHHRPRVRADARHPRPARPAVHDGRRARRRLAAGQGAGAGRPLGAAGEGRLGAAAASWRSATARSTSPSSPPASGSRRRRCRTTSSPACSARSPSAQARRVLVPDAIPVERLRKIGARERKLVRFPGLKEDYYLADFEPDPAVLDELGLDREKVLVVLRPPPETSEYHAPNDVYGATVRRLAAAGGRRRRC